jgi:hypothetical protein
MKKASRIALTALAAVIFLALAGVVAAFLSQGVGRPIRWELPNGYRGWLVVEYEVPRCPPLLTSGMYFVIKPSSEGRACTSSPAPMGWRYHKYEYVHPDGARTIVRSVGHTDRQVWPITYGPAGNRELIFIGTEAN